MDILPNLNSENRVTFVPVVSLIFAGLLGAKFLGISTVIWAIVYISVLPFLESSASELSEVEDLEYEEDEESLSILKMFEEMRGFSGYSKFLTIVAVIAATLVSIGPILGFIEIISVRSVIGGYGPELKLLYYLVLASQVYSVVDSFSLPLIGVGRYFVEKEYRKRFLENIGLK